MKNIHAKFTFGLALFILLLIACQNSDNKKKQAGDKGRWLEEMTIPKLQFGYREGQFSVADVVSAYIDRIMEIDMNGPALNSVLVINPDAMEIAEELDKEMAEGKKAGPLFGVPVILKDNIDTHDRMATTAGATVLKNSFAPADSYVAAKLR